MLFNAITRQDYNLMKKKENLVAWLNLLPNFLQKHIFILNSCLIFKVRHGRYVLDFLICRIMSASAKNYAGNPQKVTWQPYLAQYP